MGLFDSLNPTGLVSSAISAIGGLLGNQQSANSAAAAQDFSAQQYATRYQTTVQDMEAAGLNPMLAYSQGAGSPPTGVSYQAQNPFSGVSSAYQSGAQASMTPEQTALLQSQQGLTSAQQAKTQVDTGLSQAQTAKAWADAGVSSATVNQINQTLAANLPQMESQKLGAVIANLAAQTQTQGATQTQLKASAAALLGQAGLSNISIDASKSLDNIGAKFGQLQPVVSVLSDIVRMWHSK